MIYFIHVEHLLELEKQEEWEAIRVLLFEKWKYNPISVEILVRLLSECWYILSEWDYSFHNKGLSFLTFQNTLIECTEFGIKNFITHSRFLCIAGYMISMSPYLFYADNKMHNSDLLYAEWEKKGLEMLRRSCVIGPADSVAKVLSLGSTSNLSDYNEAKKTLHPELSAIFPGETVIELYFKDVLSIR